MNWAFCLLFILKITWIFSFELPTKQCSLSDSDCITAAVQPLVSAVAKGLPELNAEPLDTMNIDNIKFNLAGLDMDMRSVKITGLKNSVINKIKVNMEEKNIDLDFLANLTMKGSYKCNGKLLGLPIYGDGILELNIYKMNINMIMPFEISKNANGKDIIHLKSSNYTYKILDHIHFDLTNLFGGNKQLSDIMLKSINDNWEEVTGLFAISVLEQPIGQITKVVKKIVRSKPLEELVKSY